MLLHLTHISRMFSPCGLQTIDLQLNAQVVGDVCILEAEQSLTAATRVPTAGLHYTQQNTPAMIQYLLTDLKLVTVTSSSFTSH